jgi:hypothetical protein
MKISKIYGFVAPVGKEAGNIDGLVIQGSEIQPSHKLFTKLEALFNSASKECDILIKFIAKTGQQDNVVRDHIIKICNDFSLENCKPLVKSLTSLTDNKIKEGLLFFIYAKDQNETELLIARYPSEEGITAKYDKGKYVFEVIDDVFLKNSRKYKAVYYRSKQDNFWTGYAVDKQINDSSTKEISDYWVKDFLQSELKLNSNRGSQLLAKAVRRTIIETTDEEIKGELIAVTPLVKNINTQTLTLKSFFDKMHLSPKTKTEVLGKIDNPDLCKISFQFNSDRFAENCNYLINILDTGAVVMAPAADFPTVWNEVITTNGKVRYSTEGMKVKTKIRNSI